MNIHMRRLNSAAFEKAITASGLNTPKVAAEAGISLSYAYNIRHGLVPSASVRQRLAAILNSTEGDLWPMK